MGTVSPTSRGELVTIASSIFTNRLEDAFSARVVALVQASHPQDLA
jgi:hypothetical protein